MHHSQIYLPIRGKDTEASPSVLLPGSGLSRLAHQVMMAGYDVECNEFSKVTFLGLGSGGFTFSYSLSNDLKGLHGFLFHGKGLDVSLGVVAMGCYVRCGVSYNGTCAAECRTMALSIFACSCLSQKCSNTEHFCV